MTLLDLAPRCDPEKTDLDLSLLDTGDTVHGTLRISDIDHRLSGEQSFVILTLGNRSGQLSTAPFWTEELPRLAGLARGDVVDVTGEVTQYRGRRQLRVDSISQTRSSSIDWRTLMPSVGDVGGFWEVLDGWRFTIAAPRLKQTLSLFYDDPVFRSQYQECPASVQGHHAALGGLLRHTWEVASIARAIARTCPADGDLVLAGVLLHDIGKIKAYRWQGIFETTTAGHLQGHVTLGSLMLETRVRASDPPPCTDEELMVLQHLILSHHGRLEYGAPVQPMTLEAELLHYADNASAKSASMADALRVADHFSGDDLVSARGIWQLDRRRVYRGVSSWGRI
jgi:3'-5' exoribonuclease